jgi:precorrin-3B synthase
MVRLTEAADGLLARIRLPGGLADDAQLRALAHLADELGDGRVELTSRANVQLRGLRPDSAEPLTDELIRAGLLPSLSHDQVRNVLASPLAGLDRGPDLTSLVRALDADLCARSRLAELSGRFLFAVDDGRGDVAGLGADVVATVGADGAVVNGLAVRAASESVTAGQGVPHELRDAVVTAMLACAEAFLDLRADLDGPAWRIADLPGGDGRIRAAVAAHLGLDEAPPRSGSPGDGSKPGTVAGSAGRPVGLVGREETRGRQESAAIVRDDDRLSVVLLAPLGRLTAAQLTWVAARAGTCAGAHAGEREARVTPWRSVVLPHVDDAAGVLREAAALGFGTDESSPWVRVTACAGRPGCARALADVQRDAAEFAARWPGVIVHVSGCERHCGRPAATEIDVTATSEGYQVAGI